MRERSASCLTYLFVAVILLAPNGLPAVDTDTVHGDTDGAGGKGDSVTVEGTYTGFYDYPAWFFQQGEAAHGITPEDVVNVTDAQYLALKEMHNGKTPYSFCPFYYKSEVYGMANGEAVFLGKYAAPSRHDGHHCWHVMGHEQAHNFFTRYPWYFTVAADYVFDHEAFAVLSTVYTYHVMLEKQDEYGLSSKIVDSLDYIYNEEEMELQRSRYEQYVEQGCPFDITDILTSQTFDYKMICLGNQYGWHTYEQVTKAFEEPLRSRFSFHYDGVTPTECSTYNIAALSIAFNRDFRPDFRALDFPIDDELFDTCCRNIADYVVGGNAPPRADAGGPYHGHTGTSIAFDGTGSCDLDGDIVSYNWAFGDSTTSHGMTTAHTYQEEGRYTVTLTVTDDEGTTTMNQTTVVIDDTPPEIALTRPRNGIYLIDRELCDFPVTVVIGAVDIEAEASDHLSGIQQVEFHIDGTQKAVVTEAPYRWPWENKESGIHRIEAVAVDTAGNTVSDEVKALSFRDPFN